MNKLGKYYEKKTASIIQKFEPDALIQSGVYIEGKLTKLKREVDVQLVKPDEYEILMLECKDHQAKIDIKEVEAWTTKLQDLGSKKGAIVSNSGFTKGALQAAKAHKIDLLSLVDSEDSNIRAHIYLRAFAENFFVESYSLALASKSKPDFILNPIEETMIIVNQTPKLWIDVLRDYWNAPSLNLESIQKGENEYVLRDPKILDAKGKPMTIDKLTIHFFVGIRYLKRAIRVVSTQGIMNITQNTYRTSFISTENINMSPKDWQQITDEEAKSIKEKHLLTMGLITKTPL